MTPVHVIFLSAARSVSIVRVCPVSEKEYLSKYTLSVPLGALEWNWFPPEVVAQWFEKSDQFPDPPTQKYFDALSAQPFMFTAVPEAVPGHRSIGSAIPSASESGYKLTDGVVGLWGFVKTIFPKNSPPVVAISDVIPELKTCFFKLVFPVIAYINVPEGSTSKSVTLEIEITELPKEWLSLLRFLSIIFIELLLAMYILLPSLLIVMSFPPPTSI